MNMSLRAFCTLSMEGFDSKNTFIKVVCTHGFVFGCWCVNSKFGKSLPTTALQAAVFAASSQVTVILHLAYYACHSMSIVELRIDLCV